MLGPVMMNPAIIFSLQEVSQAVLEGPKSALTSSLAQPAARRQLLRQECCGWPPSRHATQNRNPKLSSNPYEQLGLAVTNLDACLQDGP